MKQVGQIAADRTRNPNNFTCARDRNMYDMSLERELKNLQEWIIFDNNNYCWNVSNEPISGLLLRLIEFWNQAVKLDPRRLQVKRDL